MPVNPISPNPITEKTEQGILNRSFDKRYEVLATEILFENASGDALLVPSATNPLPVNAISGSSVSLVPTTSGGLSTFHLASAGSTNATVVKNAAGQLYGYFIANTSSSYRYLAFHNSASTPTAGAAIFFKIGIPAGAGANVEFTNGIAFSSGIAITTVTGAADNDANAVTANDLIINLFYK